MESYKLPTNNLNDWLAYLDSIHPKKINLGLDRVSRDHVFEHIVDDLKAMSEIYRVLKNKGWAILQVPIDENLEITYEDDQISTPKEREKAFGQVDHVRQYGKDYKKRLEVVGFKVYESQYTDTFSQADKFRFGLPKNRTIYLCRKMQS